MYNKRVTLIQDLPDDNVVIRTPDSTYETRYAVVAGSPVEAGKIQYNPPLPNDAIQLSRSIATINFIALQIVLAWDSAWWTEINGMFAFLPFGNFRVSSLLSDSRSGVGSQTIPDYRNVENKQFYALAFEVTGNVSFFLLSYFLRVLVGLNETISLVRLKNRPIEDQE